LRAFERRDQTAQITLSPSPPSAHRKPPLLDGPAGVSMSGPRESPNHA
jgi:hypothetical protein